MKTGTGSVEEECWGVFVGVGGDTCCGADGEEASEGMMWTECSEEVAEMVGERNTVGESWKQA